MYIRTMILLKLAIIVSIIVSFIYQVSGSSSRCDNNVCYYYGDDDCCNWYQDGYYDPDYYDSYYDDDPYHYYDPYGYDDYYYDGYYDYDDYDDDTCCCCGKSPEEKACCALGTAAGVGGAAALASIPIIKKIKKSKKKNRSSKYWSDYFDDDCDYNDGNYNDWIDDKYSYFNDMGNKLTGGSNVLNTAKMIKGVMKNNIGYDNSDWNKPDGNDFLAKIKDMTGMGRYDVRDNVHKYMSSRNIDKTYDSNGLIQKADSKPMMPMLATIKSFLQNKPTTNDKIIISRSPNTTKFSIKGKKQTIRKPSVYVTDASGCSRDYYDLKESQQKKCLKDAIDCGTLFIAYPAKIELKDDISKDPEVLLLIAIIKEILCNHIDEIGQTKPFMDCAKKMSAVL